MTYQSSTASKNQLNYYYYEPAYILQKIYTISPLQLDRQLSTGTSLFPPTDSGRKVRVVPCAESAERPWAAEGGLRYWQLQL